MEPNTAGMDLARIVEDFFVALSDGGYIGPCDCCGFPAPSPFIDPDTDDLFCRNCRINHMNGEHHG